MPKGSLNRDVPVFDVDDLKAGFGRSTSRLARASLEAGSLRFLWRCRRPSAPAADVGVPVLELNGPSGVEGRDVRDGNREAPDPKGRGNWITESVIVVALPLGMGVGVGVGGIGVGIPHWALCRYRCRSRHRPRRRGDRDPEWADADGNWAAGRTGGHHDRRHRVATRAVTELVAATAVAGTSATTTSPATTAATNTNAETTPAPLHTHPRARRGANRHQIARSRLGRGPQATYPVVRQPQERVSLPHEFPYCSAGSTDRSSPVGVIRAARGVLPRAHWYMTGEGVATSTQRIRITTRIHRFHCQGRCAPKTNSTNPATEQGMATTPTRDRQLRSATARETLRTDPGWRTADLSGSELGVVTRRRQDAHVVNLEHRRNDGARRVGCTGCWAPRGL